MKRLDIQTDEHETSSYSLILSEAFLQVSAVLLFAFKKFAVFSYLDHVVGK